MADTTIDISNISPRDVQRAGWATEATLTSLLGSSQGASKILRLLAENAGVSVAELKKIKDVTVASNATAAGAKKNDNDDRVNRRKFDSSLVKGMHSMHSNLHSAIHTQIEDPTSIIAGTAAGIRSLSGFIGESNSKLAKLILAVGITTDVFATLTKAVFQVNDIQRNLYANGILVNNGFAGLSEAASAAGLSTQEFAEILSKNGAVAASIGTQRTLALSKMFATTTKNGADFAMTNKESQSTLMDVMDTMQNMGVLRNMSDKQVIALSTQYAMNLNDLSAATGRNRDEISKNTKAMMATPEQWLTMQTLPAEIRANLLKVAETAAGEFGEQGGRVMNEIAGYITSGVRGFSPEMQKLMSGVGRGAGQMLAEAAEQAKANNPEEAAKGIRRFNEALHSIDPEIITKIMQGSDQSLKSFIGGLGMAGQAAINNAENEKTMTAEEKAKRQSNIDSLKIQTQAFNQVKAALAEFQNELKSMAADVMPIVIPAFKVLTSALQGLTEGFKWLSNGMETVAGMLGFSKGTVDKNGNTDPNTNTAKGVGGILAAITLIAGGAIMKKLVMMLGGAIVKDVLPSVGNVAGKAGGGMLGGIGSGLGAIGNGLKGFGSGVGKLIEGILVGIANGLAALGRPQVLLGTVSLAGIAAAMWIAGKAFDEFSNLKWPSIALGLGTIAGIGALGALAGVFSEVIVPGAIAIGALGVALIPLAAAARIAAPAMEILGDALRKSFDGISGIVTAVGSSISTVMDAFTKMQTAGIAAVTDQITKLNAIPSDELLRSAAGITAMKQALQDFTPGAVSGFSQWIGSLFASDPVSKLQGLAQASNPLGRAANDVMQFSTGLKTIFDQLDDAKIARLDRLAASFSRLSDAFSRGVPRRATQEIQDAITGMVAALFPQSTTTTTGPTSPVITTVEINQLTKQYYIDSMLQFKIMVDQLSIANDRLATINTTTETGARNTVSAVNGIGRIR